MSQSQSNRTWQVGRFGAVLLVCLFVLVGAMSSKRLRIAYHRQALDWNARQLASGLGRRPSLYARTLGFQGLMDWSKYHRRQLVELEFLAHRRYLFPRLAPGTPESNWLGHAFRRAQQSQRGKYRFSSSGGTVDPVTGDRTRSIELWTTPEDVAYWDAWKEQIDAMSVEQMRIAAQEDLPQQRLDSEPD